MNRVKYVSVTLALALFIIIPSVAMGHSGGLDKNGCHTNRKTGDYHCHGAPAMTPVIWFDSFRSPQVKSDSTCDLVGSSLDSAFGSSEREGPRENCAGST